MQRGLPRGSFEQNEADEYHTGRPEAPGGARSDPFIRTTQHARAGLCSDLPRGHRYVYVTLQVPHAEVQFHDNRRALPAHSKPGLRPGRLSQADPYQPGIPSRTAPRATTIIVLILYPLVNTRVAPEGKRGNGTHRTVPKAPAKFAVDST